MRLAFIGGCGHHYLQAALTDPTFAVERPVAVAGDGVDNGRAQTFAASLGETVWHDDARQMLDTVRPDVVSIGAVFALNGRFAADALERGIAVVSDKPLAATWEELARIKALADSPQRIVLTEFPFRAQPEFQAMQAAVAEGAVGEVVLATAQKSYVFGERPLWYADRALYGGTLLWVASHGIDAIRFVTGQRMHCVFGRQGNVSQPGYGTMEDHVACVFALEGGGTGIVHADYLQAAGAKRHGDDRLRVAGSRGILEVKDGRCLLTTHKHPPQDITNTAAVRPMHRELLAAISGEASAFYSTAASLEAAALLLQARDAADLP